MPLPSLDFSPVQQGFRDIGDAVTQHKRLQDERDATAASLAMMSKFNDQMREIQKSGDFSQDWGTLGRQAAESAIDEQEELFHDPETFAAFKKGQMGSFENHVPQLRESFDTAAAKHDTLTLANIAEQANGLAATDLSRAATTLNTGWGADVRIDENTGTKSVSFNSVAMNAFRQDGQAATGGYQAAVDGLGASYVSSKIGDITQAQGTAAQKLQALQTLQGRALTDVEAANLHVSAATREKLDASLAAAVATTQKAAIQEKKDAGFSELAARVSAIGVAYNDAKLSGRAFDPSAALAPMLTDKTLDKDVREAVNGKLKEYALEADKDAATKKKILDANLLRMKQQIQVYLDHGASTDFIQGKMNEWLRNGPDNGGLAVDNYAAAKEFADNAPKLAKDMVLQGVAAQAFKDLPDGAKTKLGVRFAELAGGLYAGQDPNAYKDPATGRWMVDKLTKAAQQMAEAEKSDVLKQILTSHWFGGKDNVVEPDELALYIKKATNGELVGQFADPGAAVERASKFTDAAWYDLLGRDTAKTLPRNAKGEAIRPQARINVYTKAGLPTFIWDDGRSATPSVKDGKIVWTFAKYTPADASAVGK